MVPSRWPPTAISLADSLIRCRKQVVYVSRFLFTSPIIKEAFVKKLWILLVLGIFVATPVFAAGDINELGKSLVVDVWSKMKAGDTKALSQMMSDGFQSVHTEGAIGKKAEIDLIAGLNLGDYTLTEFATTVDGPVMVVTYMVSVAETIEGVRLNKHPAARMTVFVNTGDAWKWIGHANLKPISK